MSDYMGDLTTYFSAGNTSLYSTTSSSSAYDLDMSDFLNLMVAELTNQSIDNTADTSDMLNQMVMMQMVSALTNMTDASIMSYAASLVGKTVTVGQYNSDGTLDEIVGEVTGTGTMNGEQVVFVNDKYYYMNEIMAVGVLPSSDSGSSSDSSSSVEESAPAVQETPEISETTDQTDDSSDDSGLVEKLPENTDQTDPEAEG